MQDGTKQNKLSTSANPVEGRWDGCIVQHYTYDWQTREESPQQRQTMLENIRHDISNRALAHLQAGRDSVLVVATPPGTGKSTAVAALGDPQGEYRLNLAWIAERHDMADQVPALTHYNHIRRCTHENCPEGYRLHEMLLERGLPTFWLHQQHATPCKYLQQFHQETSAFYQLAHVRTAHPAKHPDGIVIDELALKDWLEPYAVTRQRLLEARASCPAGNDAWQLLTATLDVMHEATATAGQGELSGRVLFAALDTRLGGHLLDILAALRGDPNATILYPQPHLPDLMSEDDDGDGGRNGQNAMQLLREQPPRVLAHLWHALADEMDHYYHHGHDAASPSWNSRMRIGPGQNRKGDWALSITTPRSFKVADDAVLPPRIVLDGTANMDYLRRLLPASSLSEMRVQVPQDLLPPPGMRHIAVRLRTGKGGIKRYNTSSFTWEKDARQRDRQVAEVQDVLQRLDPNGDLRAANRVGLITFKGYEAALRARLSIASACTSHFMASRGSNALNDCDLLLVVGRPRLPEQEVKRLGSVLYTDDETPLDTTMYEAADGTRHYRDPRIEHLDTYLTRAELTQCAHRNRPLIYDHRTVVTFCDEPIDFLPITTEVQRLPTHLSQGQGGDIATISHEEKLEQAATLLRQRGHNQTVRALQAVLHELYGKGLNAQVVSGWHRAHPQHSPQAA